MGSSDGAKNCGGRASDWVDQSGINTSQFQKNEITSYNKGVGPSWGIPTNEQINKGALGVSPAVGIGFKLYRAMQQEKRNEPPSGK